MIVILSLIACLIEASIDVKKGDKHDLKSDLILTFIVTSFGLIPLLLVNYWFGTLIYVLVRYCVFDYMYSYIRFKTLFYLGNTSNTDKLNKKINKKLLLVLRILLLIGVIFFEIIFMKGLKSWSGRKIIAFMALIASLILFAIPAEGTVQGLILWGSACLAVSGIFLLSKK